MRFGAPNILFLGPPGAPLGLRLGPLDLLCAVCRPLGWRPPSLFCVFSFWSALCPLLVPPVWPASLPLCRGLSLVFRPLPPWCRPFGWRLWPRCCSFCWRLGRPPPSVRVLGVCLTPVVLACLLGVAWSCALGLFHTSERSGIHEMSENSALWLRTNSCTFVLHCTCNVLGLVCFGFGVGFLCGFCW